MLDRTILRGKDIFPYVHGAMDLKITDTGAVEMIKFTDRQIERYALDSEKCDIDLVSVLSSSAGISLEMQTDSDILGLDFLWSIATKFEYMSFDLFVDGQLIDSRISDNLHFNKIYFELPQGMHDIKLYFPWNVKVEINAVHLSKDAATVPVKKEKRVLILGDSISQGWIARHASCCYTNIVARKLNLEILNQAVGGYVFRKESLDERLAAFNPDLIIVAYGTNDYGVKSGLTEFKNDAAEFMNRLTEIFPDTKILANMPIRRGDPKFLDRKNIVEFSLEESFDALREVYKKFKNVSVLEDTYYPRHEDFYNADLLHPNDLGFSFYAEAVLNQIKMLGIF